MAKDYAKLLKDYGWENLLGNAQFVQQGNWEGRFTDVPGVGRVFIDPNGRMQFTDPESAAAYQANGSAPVYNYVWDGSADGPSKFQASHGGVSAGTLAALTAAAIGGGYALNVGGAGAASGASSAAGAGASGSAGAGWASGFDLAGGGALGGAGAASGASALAGAGAAGAGEVAASAPGWASGYDIAAGGALDGMGGASAGGLSGFLGKAGEKVAGASLSDWINAAGTVGNVIATNKAAGVQADASAAATAEARRQYDLTRGDQLALLAQQRADQQPWMDAGKNALSKLTNGFDITQDPSYQFRLAEGQKAIDRSAAARGMGLSGATLKALTKYGQDYASTEYGNQYNRLASMAGVGQTATNNIGQAGQSAYGTIAQSGANATNSIQNNITGAGNARSSGYVGAANALNGGISNWYNQQQSNRLLDILQKRA